ncbi:5-methylcytosine restriction system specificity protein McrC [Chryseobacterium sp.]|jgi:5-methylcytosine-specific restriction enzyme subunit McrC|uniref:McrC family protein n=1 Tax=Chryseobacterium sp. TaxID=1871047 RepID=UPI002841D68C|nr:restriction endonuclease [Chryseobacterium sp.]MDR3023462.1 McrC family protein [Chryseobacterium sp.]
MVSHKRIQVYEHSFLRIGDRDFDTLHFVALSKLNALHDYKYFDLKHNGIVFKQYVGVIQVEGLVIEILPKIDRYESHESKEKWQSVLIEMLRVTKKLKIQQVGQAHVSKQSIHLLDLYFEWFLSEVQLLIHQGLIKQYYKQTGNVKALKGKLEFASHIQKNLVHKERFYTTHQVYEKDHLIHQILGQALDIINRLSKGTYLYTRCKTVQLDFPEVKSIKANENTFTKLLKSRKTAPYETVLSIARLIILNYAPNISNGSEKMLALLFDMNKLWEEYILVRLKQVARDNNIQVYGQNSRTFWSNISIRPDIVLVSNKEQFIIDTKWKNIDNNKPSTHDLRQMYVYNEYWESKKSLLLYPSNNDDFDGYVNFVALDNTDNHTCGLGKVSIFKDCNKLLNDQIGSKILNWIINDDKIRV